MYQTVFSFVFFFALQSAFAAEVDLSERNKVYDFISQNLIGKRVGHESKANSLQASQYREFSRKVSFTNLVKTSQGLMYDEVIEIKQSNQAIDKDGELVPGSKPVPQDRTLVIRIAARVSLSTGKLIGTAQVISNTNTVSDSTGTIDLISEISLQGDTLLVNRGTGLYSDNFKGDNQFAPGRNFQETELRVENGKLKSKTKVISYLVNAGTLTAVSKSETSEMNEVEL